MKRIYLIPIVCILIISLIGCSRETPIINTSDTSPAESSQAASGSISQETEIINIPFSVNRVKLHSTYSGPSNQFELFRSASSLLSWLADFCPADSLTMGSFAQYTDSFFEKKTILVIYLSDPTISYDYVVTSADIISSSHIKIQVERKIPQGMVEHMTWHGFLIIELDVQIPENTSCAISITDVAG